MTLAGNTYAAPKVAIVMVSGSASLTDEPDRARTPGAVCYLCKDTAKESVRRLLLSRRWKDSLQQPVHLANCAGAGIEREEEHD